VISLKDDEVAASATVADDPLARWWAGFEEMFALVAGRFAQAGSRRRARWYLLGLLWDAERKNSWSLAEQAGDLTPDGMGAAVELLFLGR
jgi:hypothetical protein